MASTKDAIQPAKGSEDVLSELQRLCEQRREAMANFHRARHMFAQASKKLGANAANFGNNHELLPTPKVVGSAAKAVCNIPSTVSHTGILPESYVSEIPASDERILRFLLGFLAKEKLQDVAVYINGGYVRDLLLGKKPDDLDLTFCLRECPEDVTVGTLLEKIVAFPAACPDYGITEVKNHTILSDTSKNKMLDTAKAYFTDTSGQKTEVDVMPTIGKETYEENNRIPTRDIRGTPKQDAVRRDLTIGAMLLQVERSSDSADSKLRYQLFDFTGGLDDLRYGVLRGPCPDDTPVENVREDVLQTVENPKLSSQLELSKLPPEEEVQILWWAKILVEDPVRICRALRFAGKLKGFALHGSFWKAIPFALPALQSKVAGSRKNTEYTKIGGYGMRACMGFLELAFTHKFQGDSGEMCMAAALFGGTDGKGKSHALSQVLSFDENALAEFKAMSSILDGPAVGDELLGGMLASAIHVAELEGGHSSQLEFAHACDGMCVSNAFREAGSPLLAVARLLTAPEAPNSLDRAFAAACDDMSVDKLCFYGHVWDCMKLVLGGGKTPETHGHRQLLAIAMLHFSDSKKAIEVEACQEILSRRLLPIKGNLLSTPGILEVPPQLRGKVMRLLEISLRLLSFEGPLDTVDQLKQLLETYPLLRDCLSTSMWYEAGSKTLRKEFQPPPRGKKG